MAKWITFSDAMVRAIRNTKPDVWPAEPIDPSKPFKWQTRRVLKPQLLGDDREELAIVNGLLTCVASWGFMVPICNAGHAIHPRYQPGELLYVREGLKRSPDTLSWGPAFALYAADESAVWPAGPWQWKPNRLPSRFMPKWAAREWVLVKDVRCERLQDITEADAIAEGCLWVHQLPEGRVAIGPIGKFRALWDSLHKRDGLNWAANPWVEVVSFMRTTVQHGDTEGTESG